ncbi:MarR family transcriptional regulator [Actinoplanes oblitus]|uniref:MarR family transcriptional regulator n=1 Tax=Actinoplanes oblitus TaxID=3040509 RepID=A0ABY8WQS1_9ACTN|nr:MarR family transcriptional regulator [Actinoplanes oblitus]WIM99998.1 MarR family transcriptional regulator [Actinoplanes oblitus]
MTPEYDTRDALETREAAALHRMAVLCRAGNLMKRHLERAVLRKERLTWSSYDVLQLAVSRRPIDTRTIAEIACISKATVSISANDLENRGLIRRGCYAEDRRRIQVYPTAEGLRLIEDLRPRLATAAEHLFRHPRTGASNDAVALILYVVGAMKDPA